MLTTIRINSKNGKNLIGSFYNPREILINSELIHTLPSKEIRQGLSEIIKYGVIKSEEIFNILEKSNETPCETGQSGRKVWKG